MKPKVIIHLITPLPPPSVISQKESYIISQDISTINLEIVI